MASEEKLDEARSGSQMAGREREVPPPHPVRWRPLRGTHASHEVYAAAGLAIEVGQDGSVSVKGSNDKAMDCRA